MSTYPVTIRRCQHIKVNGIQCGSPAKRNERHCFFHEQCRLMSRQINMKFTEYGIITLPTLEDANSIQLGLAEVMRLLVTHQIDHRIASLLLRALRTAAANVKFTSLEPAPTHIVIDPKCVENRPLGATAWSAAEGRDYDVIETNIETNNETDNRAAAHSKQDASANHERDAGSKFEDRLMQLIAGVARDPEYLDKPEPKSAAPEITQSTPPFSENRELTTDN